MPAMPAFHFRQRSGAMNWSKLAKVDVDEVVQEVDLAALQSILDDCTFSKIIPEGNIDNFVKLARLSQLLLEYMLHVQTYQDLRLLSASQELASQKKRTGTLQKSLAASQKQNKALRREVLRYQTIMSTCQGLLRQYGIDASSLFLQLTTSVAGDGAQQPPPVPQPPPAAAPVPATTAPDAAIAHTCAECGKVFVTSEYLDKHVNRRHPQQKAPEAPPPPAAPPAPVEPTPPEAEDSSIAEGARRLAELVAKRKAELALQPPVALLPTLTQSRRDAAVRRIKLRRLATVMSGCVSKASRRVALRHWQAIKARHTETGTQTAEKEPEPVKIVQPPLPRLSDIMAALRRRVDLAVDARCGREEERGGTGTGGLAKEVQAARSQVLAEARHKASTDGVNLSFGRLQHEAYARASAARTAHRGAADALEVTAEYKRLQQELVKSSMAGPHTDFAPPENITDSLLKQLEENNRVTMPPPSPTPTTTAPAQPQPRQMGVSRTTSTTTLQPLVSGVQLPQHQRRASADAHGNSSSSVSGSPSLDTKATGLPPRSAPRSSALQPMASVLPSPATEVQISLTAQSSLLHDLSDAATPPPEAREMASSELREATAGKSTPVGRSASPVVVSASGRTMATESGARSSDGTLNSTTEPAVVGRGTGFATATALHKSPAVATAIAGLPSPTPAPQASAAVASAPVPSTRTEPLNNAYTRFIKSTAANKRAAAANALVEPEASHSSPATPPPSNAPGVDAVDDDTTAQFKGHTAEVKVWSPEAPLSDWDTDSQDGNSAHTPVRAAVDSAAATTASHAVAEEVPAATASAEDIVELAAGAVHDEMMEVTEFE
eukprot:TRINITY_DN12297_c0_g1_i1.p1 TRINITY_DN12297_c0_g1~~TRINITY_DN12297_c0_g1_i1.p1  ORF type:complete len:881 (+),score=192.45 TRINITY_DN12297_c0_g1_i1:134-2644(+)